MPNQSKGGVAEKLGLKGIDMINSNFTHLDTRGTKWFAIQDARSPSGASTYKTIGSFIEYFGQPGSVSSTLRLGDSGGSVRKMQEAVKAKADGVFGRTKKAALKALQLAAYGAYIAFDLALSYVSALGRSSKARLSMLHAFLVFQASAGALRSISRRSRPQ